MKTSLLVDLLLLTLATAHPVVDKNAKIVGGGNATPHQAPFLVSLQIDQQGNGAFSHICGGSILNSHCVLSAAHCITENGLTSEYQVVAGQHSLSTESGIEQRLRVNSWDIHQDFESGSTEGPYDLTILHLGGSFTFITGVVGSINLPLPHAIATGNVQLFGWGSTSTSSVPSMPDILQTATKTVIPLDLCREIVGEARHHEPLHDSNMCTGPLNSQISACTGDFGGPIVQGSGTSVSLLDSYFS